MDGSRQMMCDAYFLWLPSQNLKFEVLATTPFMRSSFYFDDGQLDTPRAPTVQPPHHAPSFNVLITGVDIHHAIMLFSLLLSLTVLPDRLRRTRRPSFNVLITGVDIHHAIMLFSLLLSLTVLPDRLRRTRRPSRRPTSGR